MATAANPLRGSNGWHEWDEERALARIAPLAELPGATLPMLHALMDEFGYVDTRAVPMISDLLNLSRAEVTGVLHFYHDFRTEPAGERVLRICRAESCQAMGCETLVRHVEERLGVTVGETTHDGRITVEGVYCLGNCALSPAAMLDGELHGRMSVAAIDALIGARS
jgi:formate dehydrogenase subunit gamma